MKKEYLLIGLAVLVIGIGVAAAGGRLAQKSTPEAIPLPAAGEVAITPSAAPATGAPSSSEVGNDDKGGEREESESDDAEQSDDTEESEGAKPAASKPTTPAPTTPTPPTQPASSGEKSYTLADVSAHATESSCWSAINGGVYDLTAWIKKHPGGSRAILGICGKDGSSAFNNQHEGSKQVLAALPPYRIGALR